MTLPRIDFLGQGRDDVDPTTYPPGEMGLSLLGSWGMATYAS